MSKILGSKMTPVKAARFGSFGLLETTSEAIRAFSASSIDRGETDFTYDMDRVVVKAFEDIREGASPDEILWNEPLRGLFVHRCRELGLTASDAVLGRRLLNVRKNQARYKKHGIVLSPTTKSEPRQSIVPQFAHVIEFALVRLRYRYGVSIDDILLDPALARSYEQLAQELAPELSSEDLRLAALYIRKSRFIKKDERESVGKFDLHSIDDDLSPPVSLAELSLDAVPSASGLLEIREGTRYLYVARNERLNSAAQQFLTGHAFDIVANPFWKPDPNEITLQYVTGRKVDGISLEKWERLLIHDREPVFNWPITKVAA